MGFPAEHLGAVRKRAWYKVRWKDFQGLEGRFDLLAGESLEKYRAHIEVLDRIETGLCEPGLPLGFGKSEEEVDGWMRKNRK